MAREIKFKIWDKKQKLLLRTNVINLKQNNDFILLQFTGMSDQQKTEIYEGDVVIYQHRNYTVEWEENRGGWIMKGNDLTIPMNPDISAFTLRMYNLHEINNSL